MLEKEKILLNMEYKLTISPDMWKPKEILHMDNDHNLIVMSNPKMAWWRKILGYIYPPLHVWTYKIKKDD